MERLDSAGFTLQDFHDNGRRSSTGNIGITVNTKTGGSVTLDRGYIFAMDYDGKCADMVGVERFVLGMGGEQFI